MTPKVSIGLPVYNGERYLAESIESILAQTFTDLELIICDNASTDSTPDIIARFAAQDDRVRAYRNDKNIGGARNANKVFELARGEYYRLASHDDVCLPTMIEEYARALDQHADIVVCYSAMLIIDEDGKVIGTSATGRGMAMRRSERFREISSRHHVCEPIYGLMRTSVLREVRPHGNYVDSDRVMLTELALRGRFMELPTPLFCKRFHPKNVYTNWAARMSWYNPDDKAKITLPFWIVLGGLITAVTRAPISAADKVRCLGLTVKWAVRNSKLLLRDLATAAIRLARPRTRRAFRPEDYNWE
jgi:glycosyltransferase involved in cell wall biosynthesis